MTRFELIMNGVREHYKEACSLGYEVVGVFLQGSQNYNLDEYSEEYQSDIDTKCIILPTFENIIEGTMPISYTHIRANNEHIDIKDIRVMFDMFKKQNNAYIELLFTDFKVVNPKYKVLVEELLAKAESISRANFNLALKALAGTSLNKYKDLEHPYPTVLDKINKFGYDPKQLHHIFRINDLMTKYIDGKPYKECLVPSNPVFLMNIKKGFFSLEEARLLAFEMDQANSLLKSSATIEPEVVDLETFKFLDTLKIKFIKQYLTEVLLND